MKKRDLSKKILLGSLLSILTTFALADDSTLAFPKNYENEVLYFKNDRGAITEEVYIDKKVIDTVKNNKPIPINTVITLVEYFAKDEKGADGYALKGDLKRFVVMKKNEINSSNQKSGGWQYQAFNPDKTIKNENLDRCVSCHSSAKNNDYVFTYNDIKNF